MSKLIYNQSFSVLILSILFIGLCVSCKTSKTDSYIEKNDNYRVVTSPLVNNNDTILVDELRIYNIRSSFDGEVVMYKEFGEWQDRYEGKFDNERYQFYWEDVDLLGTDERFTVITDGIEGGSAYFVSFIVYDSQGRSCFRDENEYRNMLIELIYDRISCNRKKRVLDKETYLMIRDALDP